jgi:uncharacterized protein (TIGR02147 family)
LLRFAATHARFRRVENRLQTILKRRLVERERKNPNYSLRAYARDLGINPGNLSAILQGKKGLSPQAAARIARPLGLSEGEQLELVQLAQAEFARSKKDRKQAKVALSVVGPAHRATKDLTLEAYQMISDPIHTSILEALRVPGVDASPEALADAMGCSKNVVIDVLQRLESLELLNRVRGGYQVLDAVVKSPRGFSSDAIRLHHSQILKKAETALYTQGLDEREFQSTQLCVRKADLPEMKLFLQKMWQEFAARFAANTDGDDVYEFSQQLFRLGSIPKNKSKRRKS